MSLLTYNDTGGLDCDTSGDPASIHFVKLGSLYIGQCNTSVVSWNVPRGSLCLAGDDVYVKYGSDPSEWIKLVREGTAIAPDSVETASITISETAEPDPVPNSVVLFAVDDGGKTSLRALFPTGAAIELAVEL